MIEIRFSGYGGQGIIKSGYIVGKATSVFDNKFATMTQSFGPEARGSACSAQLLVSEDKILYPYLVKPNILIAMSRDAYEKFEPELDESGILVIDEDLVDAKPPRGKIKLFKVPSTRIAEELGNRIVANIVMLGFFTAVTNIVSYDAMKKALPGSVPDRALPLNSRALEKGYQYGKELLERSKAAGN
jgi:2-oxoglutarate ferredoxin oxidoreductase subunit gamma